MMHLLPTKIHDWVNPKDFNLCNYYKDIPIGYFLKVDTESLMKKLTPKMFMKTSIKIKSYFYFSNYSKDSKFYNNLINLVVRKRKEEVCGRSIKCFVGLKSKMYTFITEGNNVKNQKALIQKLLMRNQI